MQLTHVQLLVLDASGRILFEVEKPLPVIIGSGLKADIRLGEPGGVISKQHLLIQGGEGGFLVTDKSKNGTSRNGIPLPKDHPIFVSPTEKISIPGFTIALKVGHAHAKAHSGNPLAVCIIERGLQKSYPLAEAAVAWFTGASGLKLEAIAEANPANILAAYQRRGRTPLLLVAQDGEAKAKAFHPVESPSYPVTLNRAPMAIGEWALADLDVVHIKKHRVEIRNPAGAALLCVNPTCELLNSYDRTGNCVWCGYVLAGARSEPLC